MTEAGKVSVRGKEWQKNLLDIKKVQTYTV